MDVGQRDPAPGNLNHQDHDIADQLAGYEKTRSKGFYRRVLRDIAKVESCQVNSFRRPFQESSQPAFLMQDFGMVGMLRGNAFPSIPGWSAETCRQPTGISVRQLSDWHRVIDWWFDKYGRFAVAAKTQNAYVRGIDFERVPAEKVEEVFRRQLSGEPLSAADRKALEDHLFWHAVAQATKHHLPVKIHTGYHAGENAMPLSRVRDNPASGYTFGRYYSPKTGWAYYGARPAAKRIRKLCASITEQTSRRFLLLDAETVVGRLNRQLRGWANYFCIGNSKADRLVDRHLAMRLRRWLCRKHKVPGRGTARSPDAYLTHRLGLVRLPKLRRNHPVSERMTPPCPRAGCGKTARPVR